MKRFHIEDRLRSFARMITGNYKLKVIFAGTAASISKDIIHIPPLEDTPEVFSAAKFLVAHECGHDIHSVMDLKEKASKQSLFLADILNSLEDARIERLMTESFEGLQELFQQEIQNIIGQNDYSTIPLSVQALHGLYLMAKGYSLSPLCKEAQDAIEGLENLAQQAAGASDSHEVLRISEKVYEALKHLEPEHKPDSSSGNLPDMVMGKLEDYQLDPDYDNMEDYPFMKDENVDEDETEILPPSYPLSQYLSLVNPHRKHQSYLIQHLRSIMDTKRRKGKRKSFQRMQATGSVDVKYLWKLPIDDRVMKQRINMSKEPDPDSLAFYILLDESHSMNESDRICYAGQAVAVLGEVLNELDVPFAITGYTTSPGLKRILYKQFADDYRAVRSRLVGVSNKQGTYTQEHIPYALRKLASRKERMKILLVVTDAEEIESPVRFKRAVEMAEDESVELLGLGINTRLVQQYFHTFIELTDLNGFSEELLKLLKRVLTR